jgi:hypothetical protein
MQLNIVHVLLTNHQVVRFFRFRDYATVAAATAFSVPVGYIFGSIPNLHATAIYIIPINCNLHHSNCFFTRASHFVFFQDIPFEALRRCVPEPLA